MTVLHIVPGAYLRQIRRRLSKEGQPGLAVTLGGLAAQILRANLASYREDRLLEEVALWQSVADLGERLEFFAPIAQFSGFIQELKWLFNRLDYGEDIYAAMPRPGRAELELLHSRYQAILAEHGVVTAPGRLQRALELMDGQEVLPEITVIKLEGLGELRPLEEKFVQALAKGRRLEVVEPPIQEPVIQVVKAADPTEEVELMAAALRRQMEEGAAVESLAAAFPQPNQYLPIVLPVFDRMKIPWQVPGTSLRNTPLGKTLLTLIAGELAGWDKRTLELLTAPGWGFPFGLTAEEHRLLRLAPPVKGLPAWRSRLGQAEGWQRVLALLDQLGAELKSRPLAEYGSWLAGLLARLDPELWVKPEADLEGWAELVKAWDGLQSIAETLQACSWSISPGQFLQLLQGLLDSYQIQAKRVFAERVQVLSIERLGGFTYDHLYVGGLVEGQFPPHSRAHWLTKTRAEVQGEELFARLKASAKYLHLHYPEVDREGKLNLPSTLLPKLEKEKRAPGFDPIHYPSLFFGDGQLRDGELLRTLREKVLGEGLSVSQLNNYANCPYRFFCDYVLELEALEEESLEPDARDKGIIIHEVLKDFWQEHLTGPLPSVETAQALLEELLHREYLKLGNPAPADVLRAMRSFIREDLLRVQRGFRPAYLERRFDSVAIPSPYGPVLLRGRIDRIDQHADGAYVLYDYKTGSPPKLESLLKGEDVQIAAYLLASKTLLPQGRNVGAAYYPIDGAAPRGIFQEDYLKQLGVTQRQNILSAEEFALQLDKFEGILAELVSSICEGAFPIEPVSPRICSYCAFQGICRKEVGLSGF